MKDKLKYKICKNGKFSCGVKKHITEFPIKSGVKRRGQCKSCINKYKRNYRKINRNKMLKMEKLYRENNKELLSKIKKKYNDKTIKERSVYGKKYHKKNKNKKTQYAKNKRLESINTRLAGNLRSRLRFAIKNDQKVGSAVSDLGCSISELKLHLEKQFYSHPKTNEKMSWENYGEWHIDHIKPLSSFELTDRKQFLEACHYTNLQPLWAEDNLSKGAR